MEIRDRVLIVEDDKNIRSFLQTVLETNNYEVLLAQNGLSAYSLITSQCPDLVILDLGLPDMDGIKILENVREWSQMPIIVVSARTHEKDKVEAWTKGRTITSPNPLERRSFWPGFAQPSDTPEAPGTDRAGPRPLPSWKAAW